MRIATRSGKLCGGRLTGDVLFVRNPRLDQMFPTELKLAHTTKRWKGASTIASSLPMSVQIDDRLPMSAYSVRIGSGSVHKSIHVDPEKLTGYQEQELHGDFAITSAFNEHSLRLGVLAAPIDNPDLESNLSCDPSAIENPSLLRGTFGFPAEAMLGLNSILRSYRHIVSRRIPDNLVCLSTDDLSRAAPRYAPWSSDEFDGAVTIEIEARGNAAKARSRSKYEVTVDTGDAEEVFSYRSLRILPNDSTRVGRTAMPDMLADEFGMRSYHALFPHRDVLRADAWSMRSMESVLDAIENQRPLADQPDWGSGPLVANKLDSDPFRNPEYPWRNASSLVALGTTGIPLTVLQTTDREIVMERARRAA